VTNESNVVQQSHEAGDHESVALPSPTAAPLVLAAGVASLGIGVALHPAFAAVGVAALAVGLYFWIGELLPGQGHRHEPLVEPGERARPAAARLGAVEQIRPEMPGYRLRTPEKVHPISAGVKGGLLGGLAMPAPALLWGVLSGHGIFYPVNLLAGLVLPGIGLRTTADLEQFHLSLLLLGIVIHMVVSVVLGLCYGVLLPTLPTIPKTFAWGGLLMPLLWSATSFGLLSVVNPGFYHRVDWPSFIACQFLFGLAAAAVVVLLEGAATPLVAGWCGGAVGGTLMAGPALLWGIWSGRGIWYPVNVLAAMVLPGLSALPPEELMEFRLAWFAAAVVLHGVVSLGFGLLVYGLLLPKLRPIPGPTAWGGIVLPLLWTALSYSLMGVANPLLRGRVDWAWFFASQFVFGLVAEFVVVRSEQVYVAPAGRGEI
jgi:hypothetical protein